MTGILQPLGRAARILLSWIFSFALWTLWLALVLLLAFQLYIVSANELEIPDVVLRHLEARLADAGLRATFSRTSFDPAGRVLVENIRLSTPAFADPVISARSVFVELSPWPLIVGKIEPREVHLTDVVAAVPAMLTPSGRPEEIIHNLDAVLEPARRSVTIRQLSARIAGVTVSAHGTLVLPPAAGGKTGLDALAEFLAQRFPALCRQALDVAHQVEQFDEPALELEFTPSESGAPMIQVVALARHARLTAPVAAEASDLRATTRLLLFGDAPPSDVEVSASELKLRDDATIQGLRARVLGRLRMRDFHFDLREVIVTADAVAAAGVDARAIAAQVFPRALPVLEGSAVVRLLGEPLALHAAADLEAHRGAVQFRGSISPRVLDVVSRQVGTDVRRFYDFEAMTADRAEAVFGPGWKFEKLTARLRIPRMNSYGVIMENGLAVVELDPQRFYSPEAFARVGENFARGTYEHDLRTHDYRFLLQGRLRPMEISPWFREWWPNFFRQLEFPAAPPDASVDVRGSWRDGNRASVFVFADVAKPVLRGTAFDRVRTRIFLRPAFYDGLELLAIRDRGDAHGRFNYTADSETYAWRTVEMGMDSTLDLKVIAQLLGPAGAKSLEPFKLEGPPVLKLRGQWASPEAPGGAQDKLRIEARTKGEFRYEDFPLHDVAFTATLDRDDVTLDQVQATLAGGVAAGHVRIWGLGEQRRLGFDVSLDDASLGQLAAGVSDFLAARKGQPPAAPGKFVQEKANVRLKLSASAEGLFRDPLSYRGDGNAVLRGGEIGEVPLLGTLSELLKFTALRFTEARANFKIDGTKLVFPTVTLRGSNSAIDAHGSYALDRGELEFNAKLFPFHESESIIKSVVGAVLTPLSNAFEVKLTGSLVKPQWAFVMGPTNFLRSLSPEGAPKANGKPDDKPATPADTATDAAKPAVVPPHS